MLERKEHFVTTSLLLVSVDVLFVNLLFLAGSRMPLPNDLSTKFCFHRSVGKEGRSLLHSGFPRDSLRNSKEI